MLKKYTTFGLLVLLFMMSMTVSAQDGCVPSPTNPCQPPSVPIDSGIIVAVVLGLAYGVKKLRAER